jgi:hypothetical protein
MQILWAFRYNPIARAPAATTGHKSRPAKSLRDFAGQSADLATRYACGFKTRPTELPHGNSVRNTSSRKVLELPVLIFCKYGGEGEVFVDLFEKMDILIGA